MPEANFKQESELSVDESKKMEQAKHNADLYLEAYLGNMLFPGIPIKVVINDKELYKIPIKSHYDNGSHTLGYIYLNVKNLEVDKILSIKRDEVDNIIEEITNNASSLL